MFIKAAGQVQTNKGGTRGRQLLSLFIVVVLALSIGLRKTYAQIAGDLEVNIPFSFHVGNAKLPPGKYHIHVLDHSDLTVLEITSADDSTSVLFEVETTPANSSPAMSELIFNKYGNAYFLSRVSDEGSAGGIKVLASRYEKRVDQEGPPSQEHVPAHHPVYLGK